MTLPHDEVNARLLELVYGEAAPSERAALEAHVATCAACQAELAALGDTRARLRTALDDAPVPARAHARILEAAAQAVAPATSAAPARAVVPTPGPSLWERLRGRWTFPTFATVGAIAVVLIASKVFLEPQRTVERGREAMAPATPAAMPPRGAPEEQKPTDEPRAKVADLQQQDEARQRQPSSERPRIFGQGPGATPLDGALMKRRLADARSHGAVGGPRAGSGSAASPSGLANEGASAGGRRDEERAPGTGLDDLARGEAQPSAPAAGYARPPAGWKGGAAAPEPASAPAGAAAPPPRPVVAAAEPARARSAPREKQEEALDEDGASADAFASRHVAPQEMSKKSKKADAPAKTAVASTATASAPAPAKDDAKESEAAPTQEVLARRAEQLFAARRWSEAIAAYRELLRRFPGADLKARWRARITSAEAQSDADAAAATAERAAAAKRASKAKPAEALPAAE